MSRCESQLQCGSFAISRPTSRGQVSPAAAVHVSVVHDLAGVREVGHSRTENHLGAPLRPNGALVPIAFTEATRVV